MKGAAIHNYTGTVVINSTSPRQSWKNAHLICNIKTKVKAERMNGSAIKEENRVSNLKREKASFSYPPKTYSFII